MNYEYVITNEELAEKGLDLNDYALNGTCINAIIQLGLDIAISRICYLCDNVYGEDDIERKLNGNPTLVKAFKKLQFRIIWNLVFTATDDPVDLYVDTIITHELRIGKINGIQKGLWYKNY